MPKDPAFLFYSDNFQSGTQFFTDDQTGKYIRLLCAQHLHGHLSEKQMLFICKEKDEMIWEKFSVDKNGKYYNERLEVESEKRKAFSESRKNNRNKLNNDYLHIYFIKNPETGFIKIGSSVDVERRLLELRRQYNNGLTLLFMSVKYPQTKEKELHDHFSSKNEYNEWYSLSEKDIEEIKKLHIKLHMNNHMYSHMGNGNGNGNGNELGDVLWNSIKRNFQNDFNWKEKFCRDKKIEIPKLEKLMDEFISNIELGEEYKPLPELKRHFKNTFNKNHGTTKAGTSAARIDAASNF